MREGEKKKEKKKKKEEKEKKNGEVSVCIAIVPPEDDFFLEREHASFFAVTFDHNDATILASHLLTVCLSRLVCEILRASGCRPQRTTASMFFSESPFYSTNGTEGVAGSMSSTSFLVANRPQRALQWIAMALPCCTC